MSKKPGVSPKGKHFSEEFASQFKEPENRLFKNEPQQNPHPGSLAGMMSKASSKKDIRASFGNNRGNVPSVEDACCNEYHEAAHAACEEYGDSDGSPDDMIISEAPPPPISGLYKSPSKPLSKDRPVMANTTATLPALPEDIDLLRKEVCFERVNEKIHVIMVAIDHKNPDKNNVQSMKANGDPLGGYAYTTETDQYLINCVDHYSLGIIPMAFRISVPGYAGKQLIPLTDSLIQKHAAPTQRKAIRMFREKHPECEVQFVQSLSRS